MTNEQKTIVDLPFEMLEEILSYLRGNDLIRVSATCSSFNSIIRNSSKLMSKIRIKVDGTELMDFLGDSVTRYQHLSLFCDHSDSLLKFFNSYPSWKSLKMTPQHSTGCYLEQLLKLVAPNLEEIEISLLSLNPIDFRIDFPKLKRFKGGRIIGELNCSSLKSLHFDNMEPLQKLSQRQLSRVFKTNKGLEELILSFARIDVIFKETDLLDFNLKLKKLQVMRTNNDKISNWSSSNFKNFLSSQSSSIEELTVDWYCQALKQNPQTRERPEDQEIFLNGLKFRVIFGNDGRRLEANDEPAEFDDPVVTLINLAFEEFKAIRKLIVCHKNSSINETSASVDALNLAINYSIEELRLRLNHSPTSVQLCKKLIAACPNLKVIFISEINQELLEFCSVNLKHLEVIHTLTFTATNLPSPEVKFEKLKKLIFIECIMENHPEIKEMSAAEKKIAVMKLLK